MSAAFTCCSLHFFGMFCYSLLSIASCSHEYRIFTLVWAGKLVITLSGIESLVSWLQRIRCTFHDLVMIYESVIKPWSCANPAQNLKFKAVAWSQWQGDRWLSQLSATDAPPGVQRACHNTLVTRPLSSHISLSPFLPGSSFNNLTIYIMYRIEKLCMDPIYCMTLLHSSKSLVGLFHSKQLHASNIMDVHVFRMQIC